MLLICSIHDIIKVRKAGALLENIEQDRLTVITEKLRTKGQLLSAVKRLYKAKEYDAIFNSAIMYKLQDEEEYNNMLYSFFEGVYTIDTPAYIEMDNQNIQRERLLKVGDETHKTILVNTTAVGSLLKLCYSMDKTPGGYTILDVSDMQNNTHECCNRITTCTLRTRAILCCPKLDSIANSILVDQNISGAYPINNTPQKIATLPAGVYKIFYISKYVIFLKI